MAYMPENENSNIGEYYDTEEPFLTPADEVEDDSTPYSYSGEIYNVMNLGSSIVDQLVPGYVTDPTMPNPDDMDQNKSYYKVIVLEQFRVTSFDPYLLEDLDSRGATFYALYDDDTMEEVDWQDISVIDPLAEVVTFDNDIANALNQHFWSDSSGVHVSEQEQDIWNEAVLDNFSDLSVEKNYYNILMNSLGLLLRRALYNLVSINRSGISFYDGLGNETTNIMASFGRSSAQIGRSEGKHVVIDNDGITAYDGDEIAPLNASNISAAEASIQRLTAEKADIDGANINTAVIRNSWINNLMVQSGLLATDGTIFTLDAIKVNAANITAGTIDVERLIVTVNDEKYLVHVDQSTGRPSYEKLDGGVIEDLTITADKIVAEAITAEKITTENIAGPGGWINLRNGTFAYANANTGDGISWDGQRLRIGAAAEIAGIDVGDIANTTNRIIYDHSYTYDSDTQIYTFTASVTKAGEDVTDLYNPDFFVWYLKTESDTTLLGHGKTINVPASSAIYTGTIIGGLEDFVDYDVITAMENVVHTDDDSDIYARVIWTV